MALRRYDVKLGERIMSRKFTFDFIQKFHSPICVNAFLKGLDENGISYDFQDGVLEEPSNMRDISSLC